MGGGGGTTKSTGNFPWWLQGAQKSLVGKAEAFAYGDKGAYKAYPGVGVVPLSEQENAANVAREDMFNRGDVAGQYAADQWGLASGLNSQVRDVAFSEFDTDEMNRRMNPFMEGVINPQLREVRQSFGRRINQSQANSVARGGSIGSYRVGLENAFLETEQARTLGDVRAKGQYDAYGQALSSFESDRATKLGGLGQATDAYGQIATGVNQLGTDSQAREFKLINELARAGFTQREIEQEMENLNRSDFEEERDWPMRRMQELSAIMSGIPTQGLGTNTVTTPQPGIGSTIVGGGLALAAINQFIQK